MQDDPNPTLASVHRSMHNLQDQSATMQNHANSPSPFDSYEFTHVKKTISTPDLHGQQDPMQNHAKEENPFRLSIRQIAFLRALMENEFVITRAARAIGVSVRTGMSLSKQPEILDAIQSLHNQMLERVKLHDIPRVIANRRLVMERLTDLLLSEEPKVALNASAQLARIFNMTREPNDLPTSAPTTIQSTTQSNPPTP